MKLFLLLTVTILALGAIEGTAYWWMHPAPAGLGEPVLVWKRGDRGQESGVGEKACSGGLRPSAATGKAEQRDQRSEVGEEACSGGLRPSIATGKAEESGQRTKVGEKACSGGLRPSIATESAEESGQRTGARGQRSEVRGQEEATAQSSYPTDNGQPTTDNSSSSSSDNRQPTTDNSPPSPHSIQHSKSNIQNHYSITFLPDLVAKSIPILHCSTGTAVRFDGEDGVTIHAALFEWNATDSPNVLEAYKHPPEACMGYIGLQLLDHLPTRTYQVGAETLRFEHTMFREPGGAIVQAFKGVWISGGNKIITDSARALSDQSRQIRWKAALKRFRPAHATAVQGAVRGTMNPDQAWQAFQEVMLKDLKFKTPPL